MNEILPTKNTFKQLADTLKKEKNLSRCQAYEELAREYGYKSYGAIKDKLQDVASHNQGIVMTLEDFEEMKKDELFRLASKVSTYFKNYHKFENQKLIDGVAYEPHLPLNFYNNPNEDREYEELESWWDKAYIVNNKQGYFIVYCLNGGAWDRPTRKGTFDKFEDALELAQNLNKIESNKKNRYRTLNTGAVINYSGIVIKSNGKMLDTPLNESEFDLTQIKRVKAFIEIFLKKRKTINRRNGSSYSLKHKIEKFLYHYYPKEYNYISNGTMIAALDEFGFKIQEQKDGPNIYINHETLKDFDNKLQNDGFDDKKIEFDKLIDLY